MLYFYYFSINAIRKFQFCHYCKKPFYEKLSIVEKGKPKPGMINLTNTCKTGRKTIIRKFSCSRFDDMPWLTGCSISNKLYCWPCVLTNSELSVWNKEDYFDLVYLTAAVQKHEK